MKDSLLFGNRMTIVPYLAFSLVLTLVLVMVTRVGIGLSWDTATYFFASKTLLDGGGLQNLAGGNLVHYPPLFPTILAGFGLLGLEPVVASKYLNWALFAIFLLTIGLTIRCHTQIWFLPYAGMALGATGAPILISFSLALSDALFLVLLLFSVIFFTSYIRRGSFWYLIGASIGVSLAFFTRYVGVSLVIFGVFVIFGFRRPTLPIQRWIDLAVFLLISCLPMGIWLIFSGDSAAVGSMFSILDFHPMRLSELLLLIRTVAYWVLPLRIPIDYAATLLLSLVLVVTLASIQIIKRLCVELFLKVTLLFVLTYVGTILLSTTFYDAATPFDNRILAPVYVLGLVAMPIAGQTYLEVVKTRKKIALVLLACTLSWLLLLNVRRHTSWFLESYRSGIGYAHSCWRDSPVIGYIEGLPRNLSVCSNNIQAIYLRTGRVAIPIPLKVDASTLRKNTDESAEFEKLLNRIRGNGAILVYWHEKEPSPYTFSRKDLLARLPMKLIERYKDATVYQLET